MEPRRRAENYTKPQTATKHPQRSVNAPSDIGRCRRAFNAPLGTHAETPSLIAYSAATVVVAVFVNSVPGTIRVMEIILATLPTVRSRLEVSLQAADQPSHRASG